MVLSNSNPRLKTWYLVKFRVIYHPLLLLNFQQDEHQYNNIFLLKLNSWKVFPVIDDNIPNVDEEQNGGN